MTAHFNGPLLNNDKNPESGARGLFSGMPTLIDPDFVSFFDDFNKYDANEWVIVKDTGATIVGADDRGGVIQVAATATTDNDGASLQAPDESFQLSAGKKLWFESRLKVYTPSQCDVFVGLCETFSVNPEACLTSSNRVGFQITDGDASLLMKTEASAVETSTDSGSDASSEVYVKLGFYWDGSETVYFFVDRSYVGKHTTNVPSSYLLPAAMLLSGDAVNPHLLTIDYIMACMER